MNEDTYLLGLLIEHDNEVEVEEAENNNEVEE